MALLRIPSRREFLFSAAASAMTLGMGRNALAQASRVRWAFLSDTHIPGDVSNTYRGFKPYDNLKHVAPLVANANVQGAIVDGDLARLEGLPEDYANLKALMAPVFAKMPVALSLGNHDNRKNFSTTFAEHPGEEQAIKDKHILAVAAGPVKFVILDSLLQPNLTPGLLGKDQRVWLEKYLPSIGSTPTIVFVHHTLGDRDSDLLDTDRLLQILHSNSNVKALIYGHSHRYSFEKVKDLHLINIPAVGYNFADSEPVGWVEVEIGSDGADFTLHAFGGNSAGDGKMTSVAWRG